MRQFMSLFLLVLVTQVYSAPQLISFKDGKLGVNFGGYHAGVGFGGLLGGTGTAGGLYAEAGTPHGQSARAGLGGSVDEKGGASGGLFAGATAGGNVKASAGLSGGVDAEKSAGAGFAAAQAGGHYASSGMAGETSVHGSGGVLHSTKEVVDFKPLPVQPIHKNIHAEFNIDSANEVKPLPHVNHAEGEIHTKVDVKSEVKPTVIVKEVSRTWRPEEYYYRRPIYSPFNFQNIMSSMFEVPSRAGYSHRAWAKPQRVHNPRVYKVYVEPQPQVVEKHIIHTHYKPRRQHFRKTAYIGGYIGGGGDLAASPAEPAIQRRVDAGAEASASAGASVGAGAGASVHGGGGHVYTKEVTYQRNPTFFEDIFNIPISTLKAVGNFLGNTAASTNVSIQKSASVQAEESDPITAKHVPSSQASSSAHISVETPTASKFIDDIFAIPISTLGAVNRFLENNVANRKNVQVYQDGEPAPVRLGPHARRRANKQVVIYQEANSKEPEQ